MRAKFSAFSIESIRSTLRAFCSRYFAQSWRSSRISVAPEAPTPWRSSRSAGSGVEQLLDGAVSFEQFLGERLHVAARNRIGQQKFDRLVIQEAVKAGAQKTFAQPLTVSVGMIFLRTGHSVAYPFAEEFEVFGSREHIDQFEAAEAEAALPSRIASRVQVAGLQET